ncbi:YebG family protein [Motilimonas sp. KMU-193]|uniref:YebG family protein n=1 Tax=Motilimonas sp. KMU-193 TaxID=3388668 RepID=UPI00396B0913
MAVVIKYIVERNGEEKMTFTSKKEADAYDKMLDVADQLSDFLATGPVGLDDSQLEELGLFLAANKDDVMTMLKGGAPAVKKKPSEKADKKLKLAADPAA